MMSGHLVVATCIVKQNHKVVFELDTGASCNILLLAEYVKATGDMLGQHFQESRICLTMHNNTCERPIGKVMLLVELFVWPLYPCIWIVKSYKSLRSKACTIFPCLCRFLTPFYAFRWSNWRSTRKNASRIISRIVTFRAATRMWRKVSRGYRTRRKFRLGRIVSRIASFIKITIVVTSTTINNITTWRTYLIQLTFCYSTLKVVEGIINIGGFFISIRKLCQQISSTKDNRTPTPVNIFSSNRH